MKYYEIQNGNRYEMKLEISDLYWPINASNPVVKVPYLEFCPGLHVLWGISGSGKTSFMECLAGRRDNVRGKITYGPISIDLSKSIERDRWFKQCLSMSFQMSHLLPELTCEENLWLPFRLGRLEKPSQDFFDELVNIMQIGRYLTQFPQNLSRGQQQRLNLARALLFSQEILVLDEPLVHLEKTLADGIYEHIFSLVQSRQLICLFSTHDPTIGSDLRAASRLDFPISD